MRRQGPAVVGIAAPLNMCPRIPLPRPARGTASHRRSRPGRRGHAGGFRLLFRAWLGQLTALQRRKVRLKLDRHAARRAGKSLPRRSSRAGTHAARSEQRTGGSHRCAHAWNGCGGETQTFAWQRGETKFLSRETPAKTPCAERRESSVYFSRVEAASGCARGLASSCSHRTRAGLSSWLPRDWPVVFVRRPHGM